MRDSLVAFFGECGVECELLEEYTPHERDRIDPFFWHRVRLFNARSAQLWYSHRDIDWKGR